MNTQKLIVFLTLLLSVNLLVKAQETKPTSINSGTIGQQFDYMMEESNQYGANMVVKKYYLTTFKSHVIDSLSAVHNKLETTEEKVTDQQKEIASLQNSLNSTQEKLDQTNLEKDSMSFLGILTSKGTYNTVIWSVIGVLLVLLLFFIYKFKNSNVITKEAKKALAETEEEYENHRRTALEREQKVRRQLQDEINKQKHKSA